MRRYVREQTGFGVTVYVGPGWVFHWSSEDGFQRERAGHRTWRLGLIIAVRRNSSPVIEEYDGRPTCPVCRREGRLSVGLYDYKTPGGTEVWTCGHTVGK